MSSYVNLPEHCRSLFLGDLSCYCHEQDIYNAFKSYGEIESIRLMRGKDNRVLGYGFITFVDVRSTIAAQAMNGAVVVGRPLKVGWAQTRNTNKAAMPVIKKVKEHHPEGPVDAAQVHFSFISKQRKYLVTEAVIRSVFSHFGEVTDVRLKKSTIDKEFGEQNGYGFVHYPLTPDGINSALHAANVISQIILDGVLYDSCITHSLEEILKANAGTFVPKYPPKTASTPKGPSPSQFKSASANPFFPGVNSSAMMQELPPNNFMQGSIPSFPMNLSSHPRPFSIPQSEMTSSNGNIQQNIPNNYSNGFNNLNNSIQYSQSQSFPSYEVIPPNLLSGMEGPRPSFSAMNFSTPLAFGDSKTSETKDLLSAPSMMLGFAAGNDSSTIQSIDDTTRPTTSASSSQNPFPAFEEW